MVVCAVPSRAAGWANTIPTCGPLPFSALSDGRHAPIPHIHIGISANREFLSLQDGAALTQPGLPEISQYGCVAHITVQADLLRL